MANISVLAFIIRSSSPDWSNNKFRITKKIASNKSPHTTRHTTRNIPLRCPLCVFKYNKKSLLDNFLSQRLQSPKISRTVACQLCVKH